MVPAAALAIAVASTFLKTDPVSVPSWLNRSAALLHAGAAVQPPGSRGPIRWKNHPGKCVDVTFGQAKNGVRLQSWDCRAHSLNQQFIWGQGDGKIRWAAHPEFCVDIHDHGDFDGNYAQLWRCDSGNADQAFNMPGLVGGPISWSSHPSKCLDVRDHSTTRGAVIQIWHCIATDSDQDFLIAPAPTPVPTQPYDVIVVGGGLVGSVVAAGLAERLPGKRVLLLEAGGASQSVLGGHDPPASWDQERGRWQEWPGFESSNLTRYDVPGNYETLQCWSGGCDTTWKPVVPEFQCKILGGCGVMNGALMQEPAEENFENWPVGWQFQDLAQHLKAAEALYSIQSNPSTDGKHYLDDTGADFVHEVMGAHGFTVSDDLKKRAGTVSVPHVSAKDGIRQSTTSLLLPAALRRPNFSLRLNTEVLEIVQGYDGRATGLRCRTAAGSDDWFSLTDTGLLVLSAGAMNTPRVLLASGISAGGRVGQGLSDHTLLSMVYRLSSNGVVPSFRGANRSFTIRPHPAAGDVAVYTRARQGPLTQYGPTLTIFIRDPSTSGGPEIYDVEAWVNPITDAGFVHLSTVLMRPSCSRGALHFSQGALHESGRLNLACKRDQDTMAYAMAELNRWLGAYGARRIHISKPEAMNHFVGTCALGSCADAASLRVRGTVNIAVADASLLPSQVWGHPALTLTALGLRATDVLSQWFAS